MSRPSVGVHLVLILTASLALAAAQPPAATRAPNWVPVLTETFDDAAAFSARWEVVYNSTVRVTSSAARTGAAGLLINDDGTGQSYVRLTFSPWLLNSSSVRLTVWFNVSSTAVVASAFDQFYIISQRSEAFGWFPDVSQHIAQTKTIGRVTAHVRRMPQCRSTIIGSRWIDLGIAPREFRIRTCPTGIFPFRQPREAVLTAFFFTKPSAKIIDLIQTNAYYGFVGVSEIRIPPGAKICLVVIRSGPVFPCRLRRATGLDELFPLGVGNRVSGQVKGFRQRYFAFRAPYHNAISRCETFGGKNKRSCGNQNHLNSQRVYKLTVFIHGGQRLVS